MKLSLSLLVLALAGILALPSALAAEAGDYAGRFEVADAAAKDAELARAVEAAAQQFPALFRGLVRNKLGDAVRAPAFFVFSPGDGTMTIASEAAPEGWTTPLDGTPTEVITDKGKPLELSRWMEGGTLKARGCQDLGCSDFTFDLKGDDLVLRVSTTSKRLEEPITYAVAYRRVK